MDATHIHLLLNHVPILGTLFAFCLLAYGMLRKNTAIQQAALGALVIVAIICIPVAKSGDEAEHDVEELVGISEHYLEEHEELGEKALWAMLATGAMALLTLFLSRSNPSRRKPLTAATLIFAIITFGIMVQVGNHGGKIRHSELRGDIDRIEPAVTDDEHED